MAVISGYFQDDVSAFNGSLFDRVTSATFTIGSSMIVHGINSHGVLVGSFQGRAGTPFTFDIAPPPAQTTGQQATATETSTTMA